MTDDEVNYFANVLDGSIDAYINQQTETVFGGTAPTDIYFDGNDNKLIIIPTMHDITSVTHYNDDGTLDTVIDSAKYIVYPSGENDKYALRMYTDTWDAGMDNYKVTGVLGYTDIPPDITLVATELAVNILSANLNNYKSERVGDWAVTYADMHESLTADSLAILANYRRLSRDI